MKKEKNVLYISLSSIIHPDYDLFEDYIHWFIVIFHEMNLFSSFDLVPSKTSFFLALKYKLDIKPFPIQNFIKALIIIKCASNIHFRNMVSCARFKSRFYLRFSALKLCSFYYVLHARFYFVNTILCYTSIHPFSIACNAAFYNTSLWRWFQNKSI